MKQTDTAREIVCITCPNSCVMQVKLDQDGQVDQVKGNKCKRGIDFARSEITHPMRTLCTTVRTDRTDFPVLPVRVDGEIPKEKVFEAMAEINRVVVKAPVALGEVVRRDLLGLGVNVIATSDLLCGIPFFLSSKA